MIGEWTPHSSHIASHASSRQAPAGLDLVMLICVFSWRRNLGRWRRRLAPPLSVREPSIWLLASLFHRLYLRKITGFELVDATSGLASEDKGYKRVDVCGDIFWKGRNVCTEFTVIYYHPNKHSKLRNNITMYFILLVLLYQSARARSRDHQTLDTCQGIRIDMVEVCMLAYGVQHLEKGTHTEPRLCLGLIIVGHGMEYSVSFRQHSCFSPFPPKRKATEASVSILETV